MNFVCILVNVDGNNGEETLHAIATLTDDDVYSIPKNGPNEEAIYLRNFKLV